MELQGRRVVVTGASRGIGEAIARHAADAGASVVLVARSADRLAELAEATGGVAVPADLTDPAVVDGLVERIEDEIGPIDVWVNNAGIDIAGDVLTAAPAEVDALYRLNLLTPVRLSRDVLRRMVERGSGRVVNVSSMASVVTLPGLVDYSATKAALSRFSAGLELELRGLPVGITVVELGPVPSDMLDHVTAHEPTAKAFRRITRIGLSVDVDREVVAAAVIEAIARDRRRVRLPRRGALHPALAELPQRLTALLLTGVPRRS